MFSNPTSVVLADDDPELRRLVAAWLRSAGYTVWEGADGPEALSLVHEHSPAVLLLDLWMPGADGLQVLESLRYDPAADRLITILLTGDPEADSRLEAFAAGAAGSIPKDGDRDAFLSALESFLAAAGTLAAGEDDSVADPPNA